jgi:hypothetical protein
MMEGLPLDPSYQSDGRRASAAVAYFRKIFEGPYVLLVAVGVVVVLVSLPLLRGLALRENERDAIRTLRLFGSEVFAAPSESLASLGSLVEGDATLHRHLPDTRLVDDGRRLFRHGYLFELVQTEGGEPLLRAWPFSHGETGLAAFLLGPDGRLLGTANEGARFSGPSHPPLAEDASIAWLQLSQDVAPADLP